MKRVAGVAALAALVISAGCDEANPAAPAELPAGMELQAFAVVSGLAEPVHLTAPPGDPRLFIVEQAGRIRIVVDGQLVPAPFLDIRSRIVAGGERGLLSLAFHPRYAENGFFYVNFTAAGTGETRIERYRVSADPDRADAGSAKLILAVAQPFANHNGGQLAFGPDGMLFIGMGDGGGGGDPGRDGQNPATLLGAMLRIDVDAGDPYAIPPGNPFAGQAGARPEIWATGLRNPWRFSFDPEGGMFYVADVGQNRVEEINARPVGEAGVNYGWNVMEGSVCFPPGSNCNAAGLVLPVLEYPNGAEGCSVTGGYVYRGSAIPELRGHYFHGDYCRGTVRSFRLAGDGRAREEREWAFGRLGSITSFGEDAAREIYVLVHGGTVFRIQR